MIYLALDRLRQRKKADFACCRSSDDRLAASLRVLLPDELTSSARSITCIEEEQRTVRGIVVPENGTAASQSWNVEIECLDASGSYHLRDE